MALTPDQTAAVTVLLQSGNSIKDISKLASLDIKDVTEVARGADIEPDHQTLRRAKELYASSDGKSYQEIAQQLNTEGMKAPGGKKVHYLTVSTWVANMGWRWGGSESGDYVPPTPGSVRSRSRYSLRMSKSTFAEVNNAAAIEKAADAAWEDLQADRTSVVQVAVVRGAAAAGVTDIDAVRKTLLKRHGDAIRSARIA